MLLMLSGWLHLVHYAVDALVVDLCSQKRVQKECLLNGTCMKWHNVAPMAQCQSQWLLCCFRSIHLFGDLVFVCLIFHYSLLCASEASLVRTLCNLA